MDDLELLEDAVVGQDVHDDDEAPDDADATPQKSKQIISSHSHMDIQHHFFLLACPYKKTLQRSELSFLFYVIN